MILNCFMCVCLLKCASIDLYMLYFFTCLQTINKEILSQLIKFSYISFTYFFRLSKNKFFTISFLSFKQKIERLKSSLHMLDAPGKPKNKHIIFVDTKKQGMTVLLKTYESYPENKNPIQIISLHITHRGWLFSE
jgi:hypothetical protein